MHHFFILMVFLSVNLNKVCPLVMRPHPIFLHVAWRWLPVPAPHWDTPGGAIVCHHVVECFTWNANFQLQQLCPAEWKLREDIPEGNTLGSSCKLPCDCLQFSCDLIHWWIWLTWIFCHSSPVFLRSKQCLRLGRKRKCPVWHHHLKRKVPDCPRPALQHKTKQENA